METLLRMNFNHRSNGENNQYQSVNEPKVEIISNPLQGPSMNQCWPRPTLGFIKSSLLSSSQEPILKSPGKYQYLVNNYF